MGTTPAKEPSLLSRILWWLPFLACLPPLVFLLERDQFLASGPVSTIVQISGAVLNLSARAVFRLRSFHAGASTTSGALVTRGPYRFVRHPVYTSILLVLVGACIAHPLPSTFAAAAIIVVATLTRIHLEEKTLRATYPEYEAYASRTKRILPGVW